ncbi:MAG: fumarylacetoacetate hydrolase family protein [Hyphomonadaceae bacterium]
MLDLARAAELSGKANPAFTSMLALIEAGPAALDAARALAASPPKDAVFPSAECTLSAPLPLRSTQIRDCLTFRPSRAAKSRPSALDHACQNRDKMRAQIEASGQLEVPKTFYDFPLYYISNRMSVAGPEVAAWPPYSQTIDYEMEWAAVIGSECRAVIKTKLAAPFSATPYSTTGPCAMNNSAPCKLVRSISVPARGKDFCNGAGPCIVTADEIPIRTRSS